MEEKENLNITYASSIENADFAFYEWLDNDLNLSCNSQEGFKKTPVIWVTPERAFQIKNNKEFRDLDGTLNLPMITLERSSILKEQKNSTVFFANIPEKNNRRIIAKRINQKKTAEFANATNKKMSNGIGFVSPKVKNQKIVYQFDSYLLPVYVTITYNITLLTQYQQQMNELLQPFLTKTGSTRYFTLTRNGYKYECFIEPNFEVKNNISSMEEEERRFITNITVKMLANFVSDGENQADSLIKTYENAVEINLNRELLTVVDQKANINKLLEQPDSSNTGRQVYSNILLKKVYVIGDGISDKYIVRHNMNTRDIIVIVRENGTDYAVVQVAISYADVNYIEIDMGGPIQLNSFTVTVMG